MQREESVFNKVKKFLDDTRRREPLWWYRTHGGGRTKRGLPDICIVYRGLAIWIELKKPGGVASKLQLRRIKEIKSAGGLAAVADCVANVQSVLQAAKGRLDQLERARASILAGEIESP